MAGKSGSGTIGAVERSIEIVDAIQELEGARVSELAEYLNLAPSTIHSHLKTLEEHRYLIKEGDIYQIGLEFLNKGGSARVRKSSHRLSFDIVEELAEETQERAQFLTEEHGRGYYLHTASGSNAVVVRARIGRINYLHGSAAGKAILAFLPEEKVEAIFNQWGLPEFTENTITDREELLDELETTRERGYSFNFGESVTRLRAVGVPVLDPNDRVVGSLSLSGPKHRLEGEKFTDEIPNLLLGAANELELNIEFGD